MCRAAVAPVPVVTLRLTSGLLSSTVTAIRHVEPVQTGVRGPPGHTSSWFELNHTRLALLAFGAVEASAFVIYLLLGRGMWFWADKWDFLAARTAGDLGDLSPPARDPCLT